MKYDRIQDHMWIAPSLSAAYTYSVEIRPRTVVISEGDGHFTGSAAEVIHAELLSSTHWQQLIKTHFGVDGLAEILDAVEATHKNPRVLAGLAKKDDAIQHALQLFQSLPKDMTLFKSVSAEEITQAKKREANWTAYFANGNTVQTRADEFGILTFTDKDGSVVKQEARYDHTAVIEDTLFCSYAGDVLVAWNADGEKIYEWQALQLGARFGIGHPLLQITGLIAKQNTLLALYEAYEEIPSSVRKQIGNTGIIAFDPHTYVPISWCTA